MPAARFRVSGGLQCETHGITLPASGARPLFERILRSIEIALACDLVHGDLSAFNTLYWHGRATIIDFPQSADAHLNTSAFSLLQRDVENICDYFADYGVRTDPARLTRQLWQRVLRPTW